MLPVPPMVTTKALFAFSEMLLIAVSQGEKSISRPSSLPPFYFKTSSYSSQE